MADNYERYRAEANATDRLNNQLEDWLTARREEILKARLAIRIRNQEPNVVYVPDRFRPVLIDESSPATVYGLRLRAISDLPLPFVHVDG